jgi:polysaccharide biosynthesis protein PslH
MNILFLSTWFPYPPDNGSKIRVHHLLRALARKHRVTLASFAFDTALPDTTGRLTACLAGVSVVRVDPFCANGTSAFRTFLATGPVTSRPIPAMTNLIDGLQTIQRFDGVIASTDMMSSYAIQGGQGAARILEEHNSAARWLFDRYRASQHQLHRLRYWASWKKQRRYEERVFSKFHLITMVSEQDCVATRDAFGSDRPRVEVVSNGVDCEQNLPSSAPMQPNTLVYNGALTYDANLDAMQFFLREIFPLVTAAEPDSTLTITGSTTGVDLDSLALTPQVRLSGYLDDVRSVVGGAAVCVIPIRKGGGTRLKILEAMALGTPVISTAKGAEGLDVVDGEHLLIAGEPQEFAAATVELLRNAPLRQRLAENARRLVEQKYDWEQIGRQFVALVEGVVRERALVGR